MSDHYFNDMTPTEFAEHMEEIFPEFGALDVEEVLQQQRSAYLYIQENKSIKPDVQTRNRSRFSAYEDESWWEDIEQLTVDEALARSLQLECYSGDDSDVTRHLAGTIESPPPAPRVASLSRRHDNIDPDNMTYEELQSLDEASGNEHKGLSEHLISRLPTFKYKAGSSAGKQEDKECVICCSAYDKGDTLTTLPCAHQYHTYCINHWLKLKKNCPVCKKEVRED
ncbi:unnamed protein product [Fraxinus pennsylvanica]|uniref:RING-type domain-containing protein n=1 Tax=Fraxinus pennsylvanica TaxID=56036 RepID=A0AAD1Z3X2_9LAMI|nr:unnamed protein product [Fraxinus pennsylvanica]